MRGALAFAAAAGVFVGTIFLGGRAIGAWDDLQSRPAAPSAEPNSSLRVPAGWIVHRVPREGFALALPLGWQTDEPSTVRERLAPIVRANPELAPFAKDERLLDSMLAAVGTGSPPAVLEVANRLATVGERERALLVELGATDCAL